MTTAARRVGSRFVVVVTAVLVGLAFLAVPAQAYPGYKQIKNQEQPWFSGPVCLEIEGSARLAPGEVEWCSYDTIAEQWTAVAIPEAPGYYQLKNLKADSTALCLEVSGGLYADGTATVMNSCNSTAWNQQWRFIPVGSWYEVVVRHSGKCLTNTGWKALQYNCDGASRQHWTRPF